MLNINRDPALLTRFRPEHGKFHGHICLEIKGVI